MTTRNKGEFGRNPAMPGGLGDTEQRALEDMRSGAQARASDEDVAREQEKLRDFGGDGGGRIGAASDGRATSQPDRGEEEEDRDESARQNANPDDERRRMTDALQNERDRLTRR